MKTYDDITALAPAPKGFEPAWSEMALAAILADGSASDAAPGSVRVRSPRWRTTRGRVAAVFASVVVIVSAGTAVAGEGPAQVVKDILVHFSEQPNTAANGLGQLDDPVQVARFQMRDGVFAVWVATASDGTVCTADSDGTWDGLGLPEPAELEYACAPMVIDHRDPDRLIELTQPTQIGGYFKDDPDGPLIYGVSPYPDALLVRLRGDGVRTTLQVRSDSLGFGGALPEASPTPGAALRLTWVDDAGRVLGSERWVAPNG